MGFSMRTPRITWPSFKSSVQSFSQLALSAATTIRASQKDKRSIIPQSMASFIISGMMITVSNRSSEFRMSLTTNNLFKPEFGRHPRRLNMPAASSHCTEDCRRYPTKRSSRSARHNRDRQWRGPCWRFAPP